MSSGYLWDIFGIFLGIFWGYLPSLGMNTLKVLILMGSWGYLGDILGISLGYIGDILGIFWGYLGDISLARG